MPFAVGGGIKTLNDIQKIINAGAEKVIINTSAVDNPNFIYEASSNYGTSTIAVCIDYKKTLFGDLRVYSNAGKKKSKYSPIDLAKLMEEKGAGEIILQSISNDGKMNGYDLEFINQISKNVTIPVVALEALDLSMIYMMDFIKEKQML